MKKKRKVIQYFIQGLTYKERENKVFKKFRIELKCRAEHASNDRVRVKKSVYVCERKRGRERSQF